MVLHDDHAIDVPSHPSAPQVTEEEVEEPHYSWEVPLSSKPEEVTRESFSPTVLEFMMRAMTPDSCDTDVMFCLKEVEPVLHTVYQPLLPLEQIPSLLAVTMNMKRMLPLKARLLQMERNGKEIRRCIERLFPAVKCLDEHCEKQKRELVSRYIHKTFFFLPPQELLQAMRQKKRPAKRRQCTRGRVDLYGCDECVEETEID